MCGATALLSHKAAPRLTSIIVRKKVRRGVRDGRRVKGTNGVHERVRDSHVRRNSIDQRCHGIGIGSVSDLTTDVIRESLEVVRTPIDGNNYRPFSSKSQGGGLTELSPGSDHDCDGVTHVGSLSGIMANSMLVIIVDQPSPKTGVASMQQR